MRSSKPYNEKIPIQSLPLKNIDIYLDARNSPFLLICIFQFRRPAAMLMKVIVVVLGVIAASFAGRIPTSTSKFFSLDFSIVRNYIFAPKQATKLISLLA